MEPGEGIPGSEDYDIAPTGDGEVKIKFVQDGVDGGAYVGGNLKVMKLLKMGIDYLVDYTDTEVDNEVVKKLWPLIEAVLKASL